MKAPAWLTRPPTPFLMRFITLFGLVLAAVNLVTAAAGTSVVDYLVRVAIVALFVHGVTRWWSPTTVNMHATVHQHYATGATDQMEYTRRD